MTVFVKLWTLTLQISGKIHSRFYGMMIAHACFVIVMKRPVFNPNFDRNWAWPEKTWFRERLNAVKAREREGHRKPGDRPQNPTVIEAKPSDDTNPEKS